MKPNISLEELARFVVSLIAAPFEPNQPSKSRTYWHHVESCGGGEQEAIEGIRIAEGHKWIEARYDLGVYVLTKTGRELA